MSSICPKCKAKTKPDAKFCTKCGANLVVAPENGVPCAQCGAIIPANLKFCTTCGAKAPATVAAEEQARLEAEAKARREAEDKARLQAEARARREAEEQAQIEANRRAQAEEQARVEANKRAQLEDQARLEAIKRAQAEAERDKAARDLEEQRRRQVPGQAPTQYPASNEGQNGAGTRAHSVLDAIRRRDQ